MPRRPRRITLLQLLASIAILAVPLAIYAPAGRGGAGRRPNVPLLLIALTAHGIEMEAFFWRVLIPGLGCLSSRWGRARAIRPGGPVPRAVTGGRVPLGIGPSLATFMPMAGWMVGYRSPLGPLLETTVVLFVLPGLLLTVLVGFVYAIVRLLQGPSDLSRDDAAVALLVLAVPCVLSYFAALGAGHRQLEAEVGLPRLGRECARLLEAQGGEGGEALRAAAWRSPTIRRLRPTSIHADGRGLWVALHGGFDHYGYRLSKDVPNGRWVLAWYTEGGEQPLLDWPTEE